jgi:hypothetical protein
MSKKNDVEFMEVLNEHVGLNESTGNLSFTNLYASIYINIGWRGSVVSVPYSHVVWFKKHGRWPNEGLTIDHINNDPMDNRPVNLQELTIEENQKRRRGRIVYRTYGKGKYGYGMYIHADQRDGRFYITRTLSRGHGVGDLKTVKKSLGGFDTLEEAERKVVLFVEEIRANDLSHMPEYNGPNQKKSSIKLMVETKRIRELRASGHTMQEIADITGFSLTTIFHKTKNMGIAKMTAAGANNGGAKIDETTVRAIRARHAQKATLKTLSEEFNISQSQAHNIVTYKLWKHVE